MKRREDVPRRQFLHAQLATATAELAKALQATPTVLRGLRASLGRIGWRVWLLLAGFVVQVVLTVMMWQLVDLSLALMEVWTELARKHLEIVLS